MIPAEPGWVAVIQPDDGGSEVRLPVVAWGDSRHAMVVHQENCLLVPAYTLDGFKELREDHPRLVAIMPGGGWRVAINYNDGGTEVEDDTPLVGWGLTATGDVMPVITDTEGNVEDVRNVPGRWRIYHPDENTSPLPPAEGFDLQEEDGTRAVSTPT